MNPNITYIPPNAANSISCLPTSKLSAYILTPEEQQYIENLPNETASVISTQLLIAAIKAGSSLYTQPELNKTYARRDSSFAETDKNNFKKFLNTKMVGNVKVTLPDIESK